MEGLMANVKEAIEGCLSVEIDKTNISGKDKVLELAV